VFKSRAVAVEPAKSKNLGSMISIMRPKNGKHIRVSASVGFLLPGGRQKMQLDINTEFLFSFDVRERPMAESI
jgi:hypothetical protein